MAKGSICTIELLTRPLCAAVRPFPIMGLLRSPRLAYVRRCLEAMKAYNGPMEDGPLRALGQQTGLRSSTLRKCGWLIKSGDAELLDAVWDGQTSLNRAYQQVRAEHPQLFTPAQYTAKRSIAHIARWARYTPEQRAVNEARISAAGKTYWAHATPEQRAAHGAKISAGHAAAKAQQQPKPSA